MTIEIGYFSPTTPGAASFDVDVTDEARRGRIGPYSGEAQMAAVGSGNQVLDDIDSTLGHDADGILGLKQWYVNETACPAGNQRVYTGYTFNRNYNRGDSLVQGAARKVDVTLMDPNAFLDFRVFAPEDVDPTSSFVRPAEATDDRIAALLAVDFLSTTLFDIGYIPTTGHKPLDAHDYTGMRPSDVVRDIANVLGWNPFVLYDEPTNQLVLWFDDWTTDGTATLVYDSTLKLTNVESEWNGTDTFYIEMNAVETVDPSRVIAGVWVMGKGVNVYRTRPQTAWTFGWRDAVMEAQHLSDPAKLADLGDRYLLDNSTEDHKITCTVQVPAALVTAIHEGMRIQLHATHLPSVAADFTWCRILHRTVRVDIETQEYYWLDLELSPITAPAILDVPQWANLRNGSGGFGIDAISHIVLDSSLGFVNPVGGAAVIPGDGFAALLVLAWTTQSIAGTQSLDPDPPADAVMQISNTAPPTGFSDYQAGFAEMILDPTSGAYTFTGTTGGGPDGMSTLACFLSPAGSPYSRVQSAIANGDTATLASPATAGNLLILAIACSATGSYFPGNANDNTPDIPLQSGWTAVAPRAYLNYTFPVDYWGAERMYYKIAAGGETATTIDPGTWPFYSTMVVEYAP